MAEVRHGKFIRKDYGQIVESEQFRKDRRVTATLRREAAQDEHERVAERKQGWSLENPALLVTLPSEQGLIPASVLLELSPKEVALYAIRRRIALPCGDFTCTPQAVIENAECDSFGLHAMTLAKAADAQEVANNGA